MKLGHNLDLSNISKIMSVPTPTNDLDVANKLYVDRVAQGIKNSNTVKYTTINEVTGTYDNGNDGVGATLTQTITETSVNVTIDKLNQSNLQASSAFGIFRNTYGYNKNNGNTVYGQVFISDDLRCIGMHMQSGEISEEIGFPTYGQMFQANPTLLSSKIASLSEIKEVQTINDEFNLLIITNQQSDGKYRLLYSRYVASAWIIETAFESDIPIICARSKGNWWILQTDDGLGNGGVCWKNTNTPTTATVWDGLDTVPDNVIQFFDYGDIDNTTIAFTGIDSDGVAYAFSTDGTMMNAIARASLPNWGFVNLYYDGQITARSEISASNQPYFTRTGEYMIIWNYDPQLPMTSPYNRLFYSSDNFKDLTEIILPDYQLPYKVHYDQVNKQWFVITMTGYIYKSNDTISWFKESTTTTVSGNYFIDANSNINIVSNDLYTITKIKKFGNNFGYIDTGNLLLVDDTILFKNQTTKYQNGVYRIKTKTPSQIVYERTTTSDEAISTEMYDGLFVFITDGNQFNGCGFIQTESVTSIGVSSINFNQFSRANSYTFGNGTQLIGNQISLKTSKLFTTSSGVLDINSAQLGIGLKYTNNKLILGDFDSLTDIIFGNDYQLNLYSIKISSVSSSNGLVVTMSSGYTFYNFLDRLMSLTIGDGTKNYIQSYNNSTNIWFNSVYANSTTYSKLQQQSGGLYQYFYDALYTTSNFTVQKSSMAFTSTPVATTTTAISYVLSTTQFKATTSNSNTSTVLYDLQLNTSSFNIKVGNTTQFGSITYTHASSQIVTKAQQSATALSTFTQTYGNYLMSITMPSYSALFLKIDSAGLEFASSLTGGTSNYLLTSPTKFYCFSSSATSTQYLYNLTYDTRNIGNEMYKNFVGTTTKYFKESYNENADGLYSLSIYNTLNLGISLIVNNTDRSFKLNTNNGVNKQKIDFTINELRLANYLFSNTGLKKSLISQELDNIKFTLYDDTNQNFETTLNLSLNSITTNVSLGLQSTFTGIMYDVDYSANYTNRTLIDRGYLKQVISNSAKLSFTEGTKPNLDSIAVQSTKYVETKTITANTPSEITHGLKTADIIADFYVNNQKIMIDTVEIIDNNRISILSNTDIASLKIVIIG